MAAKRWLLGEYLVSKGIITEEQLNGAVAEGRKTNKKLGEVLVTSGLVTEEDIALGLSEQMGIPFLDVSTYKFDPDCVAMIDKRLAKKLKLIPVYKIGMVLTVAMEDPLNFDAIDEVSKATKMNVSPVFATSTGVQKSIEKYYEVEAQDILPDTGVKSDISAAPIESRPVTSSAAKKEDVDDIIGKATDAPVIDLVHKIIVDAIKLEASDIHLEPLEKGFVCRYRIDGILHKPIPLPADLRSAIISRIKIMADIDISERRLPQDGRIQMNIQGKTIDLRIATFPTIHDEHVAIRILDKSKGILSLEELGMSGKLLEDYRGIIHKPYGIILVTGPTGSGKSTTLYSSLNIINDFKKNIITLEDPVEYGLENVHQSQVNVKAGLTFAVGLRSIVRLDPDVIMIGEIRDKETAEIAIHAALTGHLVFSTLHTNDAPSACARIVNMGIEPYLLASSLMGVIAQRLVRKLCDQCKGVYSPTPDELKSMGVSYQDLTAQTKFYNPSGCPECQNSGYKGRVGIYELMIPNDKVKELIVKKASAHEFSEQLKTTGMKTLFSDGLEKVKTGVTSISEVLRVTEEV